MASGRAGPSGPTVHVHVVEGSCTERDPATAPGNQQLKDSDTALQTHSDFFLKNRVLNSVCVCVREEIQINMTFDCKMRFFNTVLWQVVYVN